MKRKSLVLLIGLIAFIAIAVYQSVIYSDKNFHIVFCDVGQGDGIYMRMPNGTDIIVDAGPDSSIMDCLDRHRPFWDRTLELVFATHPDADHITGFVDLVERFNVKSYNTSILEKDTGVFQELNARLVLHQVPVKQLREGDIYKIHSASSGQAPIIIETLWPQEEYVEEMISKDTNSYSLVQLVTFGDTRILLTGDVTFDILNQLMESSGSDIDIFKASHHGSYTGLNEDTFRFGSPKIAVISTGADNRYGHPHASVLKILQENSIKTYRTDQMGDIEFISDGKKLEIRTNL